MRILVAGKSTKGAWPIRGEQLGEAIGARVLPNARAIEDCDVVIVVKRPKQDLLERIKHYGAPIVWDVVDAYPQPGALEWGKSDCLHWLALEVKRIKPIAIVAATKAMAADCDFGIPVLALEHHARMQKRINPIRKNVEAVGYEGDARYLGKWQPFLEQECKRRKWRFEVNPKALADLDIVVALREARGYAATQWKSNVKLANAQASGTPIIMQRDAGYMETASGAEWLADTQAEVLKALDEMATPDSRDGSPRWLAANRMMAVAPHIDSVADKYLQWLRQLKF